uniref:Integrin, alpha 5 (fibronectin receptor, alpha polypeptide) n=1 Tax=Astyanax mexicanus TaxID=7994 RepID=A0A8B9H9B5_ASTMX
MGSKTGAARLRAGSVPPGPVLLSVALILPLCVAFNLDVENPAVYGGPAGSYFGYSVDFYMTDVSVIVGAPKANTSQPRIREGGSVFYCPWSRGREDCSSIEFDRQGDLNVTLNETEIQAEFKSHQWFGATVRAHKDTVLVREELMVETWFHGEKGQGYCQGGFSADFTKDGKVVLGGPGSYFWQGQLISAVKEEIVKAYYPGFFLTSVSILNGSLETLKTFTGEQMGSYFGYAVATTDINNDGLMDLLVGAPMFMVRDSDGRLEELGRVYVYLQTGPLTLIPQLPHLTGTQTFGRFGSSIAPLGDLNQDGFNDVAISSPFSGKDEQGQVFIYNGYAEGLRDKPSQVLAGQWASNAPPAPPASFGFALRGGKDLDQNGYPGENYLASLLKKKSLLCVYVNLSFCLSANGKHLPETLVFNVEVQLDRMKQKQKGAVRRALFLDTQQASLQRKLTVPNDATVCHKTDIYLRDEKEFRDKLSSIFIALNFSLDPEAAADKHGLRPILNYQTTELIEQKAQILLDCGEDNICVPDLKLSVHGDRKEVYMGDDNALTLTFNARNDGGGAYEAELHVVLPPEVDYSGIARNNESLTQLTCSYETENQTRYLSCDLGNPMKSGTNFFGFLVYVTSRSVAPPFPLAVVFKRDLRGNACPKCHYGARQWTNICIVWVEFGLIYIFLSLSLLHALQLVNNGPSRISHTLLQLKCPMRLQGHRFLYPLEVTTQGPVNCTTHNIVNPMNLKLQQSSTEQPSSPKQEHHIEKRETHKGDLAELTNLSCSNVECWTLQCNVGLLERGTSAILQVRSRLWAETFIAKTYKNFILECLASFKVEKMPYAILPKENPSGSKKVVTPVVWNKPDSPYDVPLWIIILAILAGLLLLALLIYVLYKLGFFKRTPYGTAMEKAQLKPQAASEA